MRQLFKLATVIVFAQGLFAQLPVPDPQFWARPDDKRLDSNGKVLYQEIRDPVHFTVRVFGNGQWSTLHYLPYTAALTRVETTDAAQEYLRDAGGRLTGYSIDIDGVKLIARTTPEGGLSAPGMDVVAPAKDRGGRFSSLQSERGVAIASFQFDSRGYLRKLIAGGCRLEIVPRDDKRFNVSLKTEDGHTIKDVVTGNFGGQRRKVSLDAVSRQLRIGDDWVNSVHVDRSGIDDVERIRSSSGAMVAYLVSVGRDRIGYNASGKAIFYDFFTENLDTKDPTHGEQDVLSLMSELASVAPRHLVYTADGGIGAWVESPVYGTIASFWTERNGAGKVVIRYVTTTPPPAAIVPTTTSNMQTLNPRSIHVPRSNSFVPCGESTVCTYSDYGNDCTTTTYYCSTGIDTGGGVGGGSSGGGGGGGTAGGGANVNMQGDPALSLKVNNAISDAIAKWQAQQCQQLLNMADLSGYYTLSVVLQGKLGVPWSPASWMQSGLSYVNGAGTTLCDAGYNAWTNYYDNVVHICSSFTNLTPAQAADRIIHEELHSLGLAESPPTSGAMTSDQINQAVAQSCGG